MATVASMWVKVGADVRDLKKNLSEGERAAQSFASGLQKTGRRLTVLATLPLVAMGAASLKTAGDFEAGMNRVQAVSGATARELATLERQAAQLGATTRYTATQAADAQGFLAMAGFRANEILGAMPDTLQLATAAQIDLGRAADIVTNILTGYGLAVEDLSRANDVLVKTFTRTNVDMSMLGESFKYVGPVAKSAGIAFEEAAAAIGLMGNAGIQGSMAGTALRGAITRLLKPTAEVSRTLSRLGVEVTDSEGRLRSLSEIVGQLEAAGASTGDMMALFGQRAGPAMSALVDQGSEALRTLRRELEEAGGTAERIADVQMAGFRGALLELRSAFEALALAVTGTGFLGAMEKLARDVAGIVRTIADLPAPVLRAAVGVAAFAAALGPLLLIGGKVIALFLQLKFLAAAVGVAIGAVAAPVAATVAVIAGLSAVLLGFARNAARARQAAEETRKAAAEARAVQASTPEGREALIRQLEAERREVYRLMQSHQRAAAVFRQTMPRAARQHEEAVERLRKRGQELTGEILALGKAAGDAGGEIQTVMAPAAKSFAFTRDNVRRLREEAERLGEEIAELRYEMYFTDAADAAAELQAKLDGLLDRQQRVNAELARYRDMMVEAARQMDAPSVSLQRTMQQRPPQFQPSRIDDAVETAFDRVQRTVRGYIERGVPVESLAAEQVEGMRNIIRQREQLEQQYAEALGMQQRGWLDMLKGGDFLGAFKAAIGPLMKAAVPLALAFEVVKGAMEALGEPLRALLLPLRMLGEVIGRALVPIVRALWPLLQRLTIAATYLLQAFFWVSGYLQKGVGWLLEAIGKAVKFLSFGLVKSIERAGKSISRTGDEMLAAADDFAELRRELRDMDFDDALDRVTDSANRAADALLNVPHGFRVALARFEAAAPERTVTSPGPVPGESRTSAGGSVQNTVSVEIHVHADADANVPALVDQIKREIVRDARRGGATGLELVFGAA